MSLPPGFPKLYDWRWGALVAQLGGVAEWLCAQGYPTDYTTDDPPPKVLQWAIAEHLWDDDNRRTFDNDIVEWFAWLSETARWPAEANETAELD